MPRLAADDLETAVGGSSQDVVVATHASATLIGRDDELAQLCDRLGVGRDDGAGGVVLLSGDAGVGKTRLLTELRDLAVRSGWRVVAGHCLDFGESALPYLPFSEVVGRLATDVPDVVDAVAAAHPALGGLRPGRRTRSAEAARGGGPFAAEPATSPGELFDAVHALLDEAAAGAPLLLVVEDAHWADPSTRDLLGYLFSRAFTHPVAIVASYRSDDLHRRHPLRRLVAEWSRSPRVDRLALAPLPDDAVRTLVDALAPSGFAEGAVRRIVDRAEGNAFFVEELVTAGGAVLDGDRDWVPHDLADLLLVRLDQLSEAGRQVVRTASAAGRRVSHDQLVAAAGLAPSEVDAGLRQAVEMNVLVAGTRHYSFRHALLGEAVYDDLLPGERVQVHSRYVDALAGDGSDGSDGDPPPARPRGTAAELARHARRAHDLDRALAASVEAGEEALAVGGPEEAADHFERALELLADADRAARLDLSASRLAVRAAAARTASGDPQRAAQLLAREVDGLGAAAPPSDRARLLAAWVDTLLLIEHDRDLVEISDQALAAAPAGESGLRATVLAVHARTLSAHERWDEAQAVAEEALALAERLDLPLLVSELHTTIGGLRRGQPGVGLREALTEAVDHATRAGAVNAELRARYLLGRSHQDHADWDEAADWFTSAVDRADAEGLRWAPYAHESRWQLAWVRLAQGSWDEALALTADAGDDADGAGPAIARGMLVPVRAEILLARGEDALAGLTGLHRYWAEEGAIAVHGAGIEIDEHGRRGDLAAALGVYDEAVGLLGRIWHESFAGQLRLAALAIAAVARALPGASSSERPALVQRVERLHAEGAQVVARYSDPRGSWGIEGQAWYRRLDAEALRARWIAGVDVPPREALLEAWRETVEHFASLGHVPETARARVTLGRLLHSLGDAGAGRTHLDAARDVARDLGWTTLLDDLGEGSDPAPVPSPGEDDAPTLTPRESEVLELVAEGRSNGEIGRRLFISTKTVSVHVSNVLAKLGAAGRTEAVAVARRRGLID